MGSNQPPLAPSQSIVVALAPQQVNLLRMTNNGSGDDGRAPDDADRMLTLAQELGVVCQGVFNALTDKVKRMMVEAGASPGDGSALRLTATVLIGQAYRMMRASGVPGYAVRMVIDGVCNQQEESIQMLGVPGAAVGHAVALASAAVNPTVDLDTAALPPAVFAQPSVPEGGPQAGVDPKEVN